jgi:protein ImuA
MHTVHAAALSALPSHLSQAVWPGHALGTGGHQVIASGHALLDAELPGGGWPAQSLTEVLQVQSGQAEWRLLSPAVAQLVRQGGSVLVIGPPHPPFLPGLAREGLPDHRLVWVAADTPAERLWATEQALKAGCVSAVLSWLPQARPAQIRRLHACAAQHPGLFFVFRPLRAQDEASAAPLRLTLGVGPCPHPLQVHVFKRRGPAMAEPLSLAHWPAGVPQVWPTSIQAPPNVPASPVQAPSSPTTVALTAAQAASPAHHHVALDRPAAATARGHAPARRHRGERKRGLVPLPGG